MKKYIPFLLIFLNGIFFTILSIFLYSKTVVLNDTDKLIFKGGNFILNNKVLNLFEFKYCGIAFLICTLITILLFFALKLNLSKTVKLLNLRHLFSKWVLLYLFLFILEYVIYINFPNSIKTSIVLSKLFWNKFLLLITLGVLIPIIEEFTFRIHLLDNFFLNKSNYTKIIFVSLIFALFHFTNNSYSSLVILFLFSCISTFIYTKEKNITLPLAMHIINNSIYVLVN